MRKKPLYFIQTPSATLVMLLDRDLPHYMGLETHHFVAYREELEAKGYQFYELLTFQDAMTKYLDSIAKKDQNGNEN